MAATRATLNTLARVRRQALETAQQALVTCLDAEAAGQAMLRDARAAVRHEQDVAASLSATDAAVEAFVRWLPEGRRRCDAAEAALADAQAETAQARAHLAAARTASEAAKDLKADHEAAEQDAAERRLQAALDEVGQRRRTE